jgi:hypothetical protein
MVISQPSHGIALKPMTRNVAQRVIVATEISPEYVDRFENHFQQRIFLAIENKSRFLVDHVGFLYVTVQPDVVGQKRSDASVVQTLYVPQSSNIIFSFLE